MAGISTLGQALNQIDLFSRQQNILGSLTTQLASGKKTNKFSGLQTDVLTLQRSRASIRTLDTYLNNITNANRRLDLTLNAINEFKAQAENFADFLVNFSQASAQQEGEIVYFDDPFTTAIEQIPVGMDSAEPSSDFKNLISFAENVFGLFQDILNEKDGDRFLFAGAETLTQPLANSNTLDAALSSLISDWKTGTITTADLIADLQDGTTTGGNADAITDTIIGYSSVLSSGSAKDVFLRVDDTTDLNVTVLANEDPFKNILVALSYFKSENLPPIADEVDPTTLAVLTDGAPGADINESKDNFFAIFQALTTSVIDSIDEIDDVRFRLENQRVRIDEIRQFHEGEKNLLENTVSDIEDVDINRVALSINSLSIQLDASYRVTARIQQLSLVNFI